MLVISIIILFILSFQVMPVSLGVDSKKLNIRVLSLAVLFLVLGQVILFLLGVWLGNRFLHLLINARQYILFGGFFFISVRYIMDAFVIRKGERSYLIGNPKKFILPSIAQAINTFLSGLLFYFIPVDIGKDIIYLAVFSLFFALVFTFIKFSKQALSAVSLLYILGGGLIGILSFYFLFN